MDYRDFYKQLFAPLEESIGPIDPMTLFAIIGFDAGGPLSFSTIGANAGGPFITYVSCELAVREEQVPADFGRFELLVSCNDERWVRSVLTSIGAMSMDAMLGHGHTVDIRALVDADDAIQGVILEKVCQTQIDGQSYGVMRVIGITRDEMEYRHERSAADLLSALKDAGVYPNTPTHRSSVVMG